MEVKVLSKECLQWCNDGLPLVAMDYGIFELEKEILYEKYEWHIYCM